MSDEKNPLIEGLKLPGRIFQLPSKGLFYHDGELAPEIQQGELHVYPMSALDEINMKNPDQLFSGAAVETVFRTCIPGIRKPNDLLSKDVDALMLFLRAVTYGESYEFMARHTCVNTVMKTIVNEDGVPQLDADMKPQLVEVKEAGKEHSYVANINQMIDKIRYIDPTLLHDMYTVELKNGQVVKLRPNRYKAVLDLVKRNEGKTEITVKDQQENLILMVMGVVDSVDNNTDRKNIEQWARRIPSPIVNEIAKKIESVNEWGSDLMWKCKCRDCGRDFDVEIPMNPVSFFTE